LESLTHIGGHFEIINNHVLTDISGLANLTSIEGDLRIGLNPLLKSLTGLDNIDANSIENLTISSNDTLSTCEAQSICDYLAAPNGVITIVENSPGCNSPEEVLEACRGLSVEEMEPENKCSIFPNPFTNSTTLEINLAVTGKLEVKIYSQIGRLLKTITKDCRNASLQKIDLETGDLKPGIYLCVLKTNDPACAGQTRKIIKL
jgi:hypothetical protein